MTPASSTRTTRTFDRPWAHEQADRNFPLIEVWQTGGVPVTKTTKVKAQKKADEDANLNEALVETFPASDPLSMTQPRTGADVPQRSPKRRPKREVPPWKAITPSSP
jgi:hypothetical protein